MVKIKLEDLQTGAATPWQICDLQGQELLAQGSLIESDMYKKLLVQVGYFAQPAAVSPEVAENSETGIKLKVKS